MTSRGPWRSTSPAGRKSQPGTSVRRHRPARRSPRGRRWRGETAVFETLRTDGAGSAWTLGVVLGLPLALLVLTEAVVRLRRRGHAVESPLREVRNLLVPTLAANVILAHVAGFDPRSYPVLVVSTLAWFFGLHASISFLNVARFAGAEEG